MSLPTLNPMEDYQMVKNTQPAIKARSEQSCARCEAVIKAWECEYPDVSVKGLATRFGLSERQIYRYLKSGGIVLPPQKRRQMDMNKVRRAKRLYSELGNKSEVARQMKCSRRQIGRYLAVSLETE